MLVWGRRWLPSVLDLLIVGGMMIYAFAGFHLVPFHGDESSFIAISRDYDWIVHQHTIKPILYTSIPEEALRSGPPQDAPSGPPGAASGLWGPVPQSASQPGWANDSIPSWPEGFDPHDQFLRTTTGAINALTIGLAWDIAGYSVDDLNKAWDWRIIEPVRGVSQWDANVRDGAKPGDDLLDVARIPSALFTAFSVLIVYAITRRVAGLWITGNSKRVAGWVAVLIYATTPAVLVNGRRAMQEGSLLFFATLVFLIALVVLSEQLRPDVRWRRLLIRYVSFGVVSGMAVASKQTALLLIAPPFLALCAAPLFRPSEAPAVRFDRRHTLNMTGIVLTGAVVAMVAQPVWWALPHIAFLLGLAVICFAAGAPKVEREMRFAQWGGTILIAVVWLGTPRVPMDLVVVPLDLLGQRADLMNDQAARTGRLEGLSQRLERVEHESFFASGEYYEDPPWADFAVTHRQIARYEELGLAGRGGGPIWGAAQIFCTLLGLWALLERSDSPTAVDRAAGRGVVGAARARAAAHELFALAALLSDFAARPGSNRRDWRGLACRSERYNLVQQ